MNGTDPNVAAGPSIDHVVAQHFGQTPLVLGVQPVAGSVSWHNKLSWAAAGIATNPVLDSVDRQHQARSVGTIGVPS